MYTRCPDCGERYAVEPTEIGRSLTCRACGGTFPVVEYRGGEHEDKPCPACGERIRPEAIRCKHCREDLARCPRCGRWTAKRFGCADCGRRAVLAHEFNGSGRELLGLMILRTAVRIVFAVFLYLSLLRGLPDLMVPKIYRILRDVLPPQVLTLRTEWLGLTAAGAFVLNMMLTAALRTYRIRRTAVFGAALAYRPGCLASIFHPLANAVLLAVTVGLAAPWVVARNKRFFYRSCVVTGRPGQHLEFRGTGWQVLGLLLLTVVCLPFAVCTLGLGGLWLRYLWLAWEHNHIILPDVSGTPLACRFTGTFGEFFGHALANWLLTLITLGLYRPWGLCAQWRWEAEHTRPVEPLNRI